MTNEQRINFLKLVFTAIFTSKQANTDITAELIRDPYIVGGHVSGRWFVNNTIRGFDITLNLSDRTINLRCMEQNPNKTDNNGNLKKYANLARQGHQIMWVIDNKNNTWLGRIHNGLWHASFSPATTPVPNQYNSPQERAVEDAAYAMVERDYQAGNQNAAASQDPYMAVDIDNLPEIPNGVDIPDYVFDQIADMDEPPAWDDGYE